MQLQVSLGLALFETVRLVQLECGRDLRVASVAQSIGAQRPRLGRRRAGAAGTRRGTRASAAPAGRCFSLAQEKALFEHFDCDGSMDVDLREFRHAVCGKRHTSKRFSDAVRSKFREIDLDGNWSLSLAELLQHYTPGAHHEVRSGAKSTKQVKRELLQALGVGGETRARISFEDWTAYQNEQLCAGEGATGW